MMYLSSAENSMGVGESILATLNSTILMWCIVQQSPPLLCGISCLDVAPTTFTISQQLLTAAPATHLQLFVHPQADTRSAVAKPQYALDSSSSSSSSNSSRTSIR
jgi:hypothetical protein